MTKTVETEATFEEQLTWFMTSNDPRREALNVDPYRFLDQVREYDPLFRTPTGAWLATEYDLVEQICRDADTFSWEGRRTEETVTLAERVFQWSLPFRDNPTHARLRKSCAAYFTPRAISKLTDQVAVRVRELLARRTSLDTFDFREFAYELPVYVIGDILGLPPGEILWFDEWARTIQALRDVELTPDALKRGDEVAEGAIEYFEKIISDRRRNPGPDLISRLVEVMDAEDGKALTAEEVIGLCVIMHIGGHSTTTDVLTNGMYHLLKRPDSYRDLRNDPSLIPSAVEEILRYDTPIPVDLPRIAVRDVEIAGRTILAGDTMLPHIGAAGYDPKQFDDPHLFDIRRKDNKHLAFSIGSHFCIGAHLSRLEVQQGMVHLMVDLPELELTVSPEDVTWENSFVHRGLHALPVAWK